MRSSLNNSQVLHEHLRDDNSTLSLFDILSAIDTLNKLNHNGHGSAQMRNSIFVVTAQLVTDAIDAVAEASGFISGPDAKVEQEEMPY